MIVLWNAIGFTPNGKFKRSIQIQERPDLPKPFYNAEYDFDVFYIECEDLQDAKEKVKRLVRKSNIKIKELKKLYVRG